MNYHEVLKYGDYLSLQQHNQDIFRKLFYIRYANVCPLYFNYPYQKLRLQPLKFLFLVVQNVVAHHETKHGWTIGMSKQEELVFSYARIKTSLRRFERSGFVQEHVAIADDLNFAERALKCRKMQVSSRNIEFMDFGLLTPSSNICKCLFSKVGHVLINVEEVLNAQTWKRSFSYV